MKLAEALALRAESSRRIEQLRGRIVDNAHYQEGEEPAEDAARGWSRQLRSELAFISALPVADLRAQADDVSCTHRTVHHLD